MKLNNHNWFFYSLGGVILFITLVTWTIMQERAQAHATDVQLKRMSWVDSKLDELAKFRAATILKISDPIERRRAELFARRQRDCASDSRGAIAALILLRGDTDEAAQDVLLKELESCQQGIKDEVFLANPAGAESLDKLLATLSATSDENGTNTNPPRARPAAGGLAK